MNLKHIIYSLFILLIFACSDNKNSDIIRLGNIQNRPRGFQSVYMPKGQIALYIENNQKQESKIQNIRYFIGDKGNYSHPFRAMLYSVDSVSNQPKDRLLPETIIVNAKDGNRWLSVDLSHYSINFPKNGVFAAMEWIPDEDFNVISKSECQYIAYSKTKDKNKTWYCALGINWYQLPENIYDVMISIDVNLSKAN